MKQRLSHGALAVLATLTALVALSVGAAALARPTFADALTSSPSTKIADAAISTTFAPVADSYVDSSLPSANYGNFTQLRVDNSPVVKSYLRFNISGLAGTVTNATLRVYANSSLSSGVNANRVADNTWGETTITYANAPAVGTAIGTSSAVTAGTWVSIDVTPYVTGNGTLSFALTSANATALSVASREATNKPQLVISTATSSTSTPTATASAPTATKVLPTATPGGTGGSVTLNPVADVYVDPTFPSTNYGSSTQIRVDGSPTVRGYLRFTVSGLSGAVSKATLRLYANSSLSTGITANRVADNTWGEMTITYSNAPTVGSAIGTTGAVTMGTWISADVTSYVTGNGTFSFALTSTNASALSLASREATNEPQLVITTAATIATATPSSVATKTATPKPTATVTSTATGAAVLVGAGDIAVCGITGDEQTAKLIDGIPGTVATFGDNSNDEGTAAQYANCYDPTWGRLKARTKPAVGNHDYLTSSGTPYFNYFGAAAHPTKAYYSYDLGSWHVVVLNSECSHVGGCQAGSAQEQWLKADLAANQKRCTLAYWHEPRFSSGQWGNHTRYDAFWQDLYQAHATLVLNGHDHDYERFAPQNPSGKADPNGIREFVVGTGGAGAGPLNSAQPNSEVRHTGTWGVIKLTLQATSYSWDFIPVAGQTFTDSGSESCN
jgi:hypothetical protein